MKLTVNPKKAAKLAMPKKNTNYEYPDGRKEEAFNIVDKYLAEKASGEYLDSLKSIINDQVSAMKHPWLIGQTLFDYINYDIGCRNIEVPDSVLIDFKHNLINALEGKEQ